MRAKLVSVEDMLQPEFMSMIVTLSRRIKATNMGLEGELSELRAAVPYGKRCPNAEKLCYLSHLASLMKDHANSGRQDTRGQLDRASLMQLGVPVEARPPQTRSRPDVAWRNTRAWKWRKDHPNATSTEFAAEHARLQKQWSDWGPGDRQQAVSELMECDFDAGDCEGEAAGSDVVGPGGLAADMDVDSDVGDPFNLGCSKWPLRPNLMTGFLHSRTVIGQGMGGVAAKASRLRKAAAEQLLIRDEGDIPDNKRFDHRQCCLEAHPGLCATTDRAVYTQVLDLATSFERCLDGSLLHRFIKVVNDSSPLAEKPYLLFYFARMRRRRLHALVTHVLVHCSAHPDGSFSLAQRCFREYHFATLWSVAKQLIVAGWKAIRLAPITWTNDSAESGSTITPASEGEWFSVWPNVYRRPRVVREAGPDLGDRPLPRPQRRTGGVRVLPPGTIVTFAADHAGLHFDNSEHDDGGQADGSQESAPEDIPLPQRVLNEKKCSSTYGRLVHWLPMSSLLSLSSP